MVRILAIAGCVMIISVIFAANFLHDFGAKCLPPSVLGVAPSEDVLNISRTQDSAEELQIEEAIRAAAEAVSPAPISTFVPRTMTNDIGQICHSREAVLLAEFGATILAVLAIGIFLMRRGPQN